MAYNISIISNILEAVNFLSESAQCRVIKASLAFLYDEDYELEDAVESTAFKMLIPMRTEAKTKSRIRSEKMRENGMKGGRKKTQSVILQNIESKKTNLVSKEDPLSSPSSSSLPLSPTPPITNSLSIPPIIPQENSSSSCACTHAREEDFGLQVGVIATIEKYAEQYRKEGMWRDVAYQNHIKVEEVQEIFKQFLFDQKHNATDYTNYSDFKRHFLNYIRRRASAIWAEKQQQDKQPKVISGADVLKVYG
jgi:hypothetical protein